VRSSFAFPTAFNKLFLIEWFRVLNPNEQGNADLFRLFLAIVRARKTSSNHRVFTPNRHLFSKKKRERDEDSLENTVRFRASFQFFFAFVFLSQISLVPFALRRGGFFQSRFGFLSLVPSLLRESDADSFDALFSLSLSLCVSFSLSLMRDAQNDDVKTNQRKTERRKSSRLKFRTLRKRLFCSAKNWRSKGNRNSARKPIS